MISGEEIMQSTINRLMIIAFKSQNFNERISAVFTFQCYLHDNNEAQFAILSTFTPTPDDLSLHPSSFVFFFIYFYSILLFFNFCNIIKMKKSNYFKI